MAVDWSGLPIDLLLVIAMKLENIEDFIYFSAVCRVWSDISSEIKHQWRGIPVPWLFLAESKTENLNSLRKIYNPSNNKCYHLNLPETFGKRCWGTAHGWIVMIERDLNVRLFNPITKAQICFPSSESIPNQDPQFDKLNDDDLGWYLRSFFRKVIMLKVSQGDHDEFLIMALTLECLAFARHGDESWTTLLRNTDQKRIELLRDIVCVGDKVFALYYDASVVYWNVKDFQVGKVVKAMDFVPSDSKVKGIMRSVTYTISSVYLVHLDGELIMVLRKKKEVVDGDELDYKTWGFVILRLDPKKKAWRQIEDLGNMTLFVGDYSHVTLAKSLKHNCIYFTDDEHQFLTWPTGGQDMGVYDMKCKEIENFYDGGDLLSSYSPPTWFMPQRYIF